MRRQFLSIALLLAVSAFARVNVALFPLGNMSGDPLLDWVGCAVPEVCFRKLYEVPEVLAWDPVLLFRADSTIWRMAGDSALAVHGERWSWDLALGGTYEATADTVWLRVQGIRREGEQFDRKEWRLQCAAGDVPATVSGFLLELLGTLGVNLSRADSLVVNGTLSVAPNVYATYARGYGYEMHGVHEGAVSAYAHALDLDRDFGWAHYRLGRLYADSRDPAKAREHLDEAVSILESSPLVVAAAGGHRLDTEPRQKALAFVNGHSRVLAGSAEGMRVTGRAYLVSGEYQRAVAVLTRAVAAGPVDLETDFALGRAYLASGQFEMATDVFTRLIRMRPRYVKFYSFLGTAYRRAGRLMESSSTLEIARRIAPGDVAVMINLSNTYFELNWYRRAEQLLVRARTVNPELDELYINLGVVYWHMGRKDEAEEAFAAVRGKQGFAQPALNNVGNTLLLSGKVRDAIKAYRRADKAGGKSEVICYNLGLAYLERGKLRDAAECFDEVLLLAPARLDVVELRASIAERLGRREDAELYYRKILELRPTDRDVLTKLVALLEEQARFEEAVKLVESYLQSLPSDLLLRLKLPELYRRMEWYEVAVMEYEKLASDRDFSDDYRVHLGLGVSLYDVVRHKGGRDYDKAIYHLKEAARLSPSNPEPHIIIGEIYMDYKKYRDLAMEHWTKALEKAGTEAQRNRVKKLMAGERK